MTKEEQLKQLKELFGRKIWLSPDDFILAVPWVRQTVYNKINRGTFPLPVKKIGKNVFINIEDLAEFLSTGKSVSKPKTDNHDARRKRLEEQGIILFRARIAERKAEMEQKVLDELIPVPVNTPRKIVDFEGL